MTVTPSPTPAPTPVPTPTPLALPREGAYTFSCPELGLSFPVSEELAPLLIIRPGVHFFDEGGDSISLFLGIPDGNEAEAGSLARVPRREHFDPTRYYRRYMTAIRVVAASDESLYVDVGTIGGVSGLRNEDIDRYEAAARQINGDFFARKPHGGGPRQPARTDARSCQRRNRGAGVRAGGNDDARGGSRLGF